MAKGRRVRQHVNPLGLRYLESRAQQIGRPAHLGPDTEVDVELGCADAQFSFQLARANPHRWVVGLDIRDKVIAANKRQAEHEAITNLDFGYVNLNVDLDRVFASDSVDRFHLLFPDPWFKSKHHKRRVVEPQVCAVICQQLRSGGELHVASDVYEIALQAMAEIEDAHSQWPLTNIMGPWSFARDNPFGAASRREETTLARGQRVWRIRYRYLG